MFVSSFYRLHTSCLRDVGVIYQETFVLKTHSFYR